jgi:hypothetical protein
MGADGRTVGAAKRAHTATKTGGKKDMPAEGGGGTETNTAPAGAGRHILCAANRYPAEDAFQGIRAASSIHQYFSEWAEAGFFLRMWQEGLTAYGELKGLGWEWQSADGCMVKAPLAREAAGRNPADREKKGRSEA